jgi:hypothetical protein
MNPPARENSHVIPAWAPVVSAALRARATSLALRRRQPGQSVQGLIEIRSLKRAPSDAPDRPAR